MSVDVNGGDRVDCRRATAEDWGAIWPIFRAVVATGDTYMYPPNIIEHDARRAWMHVDEERAATYVAESATTLVATAYVKPNHPGLGSHVANAGWMVDPRAAGRGIGRQLAEHVIVDAQELGFEAMQFNAVVATNGNAIRLWQSLGFEIVGTVPNAFRHSRDGLVAVHVMYREF